MARLELSNGYKITGVDVSRAGQIVFENAEESLLFVAVDKNGLAVEFNDPVRNFSGVKIYTGAIEKAEEDYQRWTTEKKNSGFVIIDLNGIPAHVWKTRNGKYYKDFGSFFEHFTDKTILSKPYYGHEILVSHELSESGQENEFYIVDTSGYGYRHDGKGTHFAEFWPEDRHLIVGVPELSIFELEDGSKLIVELFIEDGSGMLLSMALEGHYPKDDYDGVFIVDDGGEELISRRGVRRNFGPNPRGLHLNRSSGVMTLGQNWDMAASEFFGMITFTGKDEKQNFFEFSQ